MKTGTIKGGIALGIERVGTAIEDLPVPSKLIIPLKQHQGAACKAKVKKGQEVKIGDVLGEGGEDTAPIHAPVSGKVVEIVKRFPDLKGGYIPAVGIESDGKEEWAVEAVDKDPLSFSKDQILQAIQNNGIVDYGIDAVPLAAKFNFAQMKGVTTLIVNGVDVEPGVGVCLRLLAEKRQEIAGGIKIIKKILGVNTVYLVVENISLQAQGTIEGAIRGVAEVAVVPPKYPIGLAKFLVKAVTGKEVPSPNGVPEDVGVCVVGLETVVNVWECLRTNRPPVDKIVTVFGAVNTPKNLRVRIGTPLKDVLSHCGVSGEIGKVVVGGPMMGLAQYTLDIPVTKEIDAIFVQRESDLAVISDQKCINCGWCVKVCPMRLLPHIIASYCEVGMFNEAEAYNLSYCVECGCCAYVCPAKIPLVHWIKFGKSQIKREEQ